jgi:hypothetical protein
MPTTETILALIARVERAMRPLSTLNAGPDHQRVQELHADLAAEPDLVGDPLEQARIAILYDILEPYLSAVGDTLWGDPDSIATDVETAIGALVMSLCRLEEEDYDTAADALDTALHHLQDAQAFLGVYRGGMAEA